MSSINAEIIALVDCDNFFVSCERVFNPFLKNRPVVVLSNKNGIVISRSQEAKRLVPMGAPSFQYRDVFRDHGVIELFTNFSLYGNMSERVMTVLNQFTPNVEIYSVDEAFLHLPMTDPDDLIAIGKKIQKTTLQWTGIPVSIGLAPTKTLAKAATYFAKKERCPILILPEINRDQFLKKLPIEEVWGIGPKLSIKLKKNSIHTAFDLIQKDDIFLKKQLTVAGLRIAYELRGIPCDVEDDERSRKSISTYRNLPGISSLCDLSSILARYTSRVSKTLRSENKMASYIVVSLSTNLHNNEEVYARSLTYHIPEPTSYTPFLIKEGDRLLKSIYKPGLIYKKLGVLLDGLVDEEEIQTDLFFQKDEKQRDKEKKLMKIIDGVNEKFGDGSLFFAHEKKEKKAPILTSFRYTTSWKELLKARA